MSLPALILVVATQMPIHAPTHTPRVPSDPPARITVELDSAYRQVVVTVGPFRVPAGTAMDHHDPMEMARVQDSCIGQFVWPHSALFHGLRLELLDLSLARVAAVTVVIANEDFPEVVMYEGEPFVRDVSHGPHTYRQVRTVHAIGA